MRRMSALRRAIRSAIQPPVRVGVVPSAVPVETVPSVDVAALVAEAWFFRNFMDSNTDLTGWVNGSASQTGAVLVPGQRG